MRIRPDIHIRSMVMAVAVGMAPHVIYLPAWINLFCLGACGYVLYCESRKKNLPPRWLRMGLVCFMFLTIIATSRGQFDSDSGIGLLCLMGSMKLYEIKNHRDRMITIFLSYFMVISGLFFSSSLEMTVYLFFSVMVITGLLIRINYPEIPFSNGIRLSLSLVVRALPLALILFVVFPRLQGSIWGLQQKTPEQTGLSDTMEPGSMAGLSDSLSVAFRVNFDGSIPHMVPWYWRGMVFEAFDGKRWTMKRNSPPIKTLPIGSSPVHYDVILEPHHQKWMFLLDYPAVFSSRYHVRADYTIRSFRKVERQRRYSFSAYLVVETGRADVFSESLTELPEFGNHQARRFAISLFAREKTADTYVDAVLDYIRTQAFYYTLTPPELGENPVDDFLFGTRRGYCEHYASAFVFLMRAAGVPARIVGGYMGGEVNPYGGYVIVRQQNAHAWAEVFIKERGWVRVDPTAAIDPSRVEAPRQGIRNAVAGQDAGEGVDTREYTGVFDRIRLGWDAVNYFWYANVVGYSAQSQSRFLKRLGLSFDSLKGVLTVVGLALCLIMGLFLVFYLGSSLLQRSSEDPVRRIYNRFQKKLAGVGIRPMPHQGPLDVAAMASTRRQDLKKDVGGITQLYILLRYGGQSGDRELFRRFKREVRLFRPGRL